MEAATVKERLPFQHTVNPPKVPARVAVWLLE